MNSIRVMLYDEIKKQLTDKLPDNIMGPKIWSKFMLGRHADIHFNLNNRLKEKIRDERQKELIGRFYPLMIQNKDAENNIGANNVQTIATQEFFKNDSAVSEALRSENEFKFVEEFINAIAFGLGDAAALEEPIDSRLRKLVGLDVPAIDIMHGELKIALVNAEEQYTLAVEEEERTEEAIDSMERKYWEGQVDALSWVYKMTYDITFLIDDKEKALEN